MVLVKQKLGFKVHQRRKTFLNDFNQDSRIISSTLIGPRQCYCKGKIKFSPGLLWSIPIIHGFHICNFAYSLKLICSPLKINILGVFTVLCGHARGVKILSCPALTCSAEGHARWPSAFLFQFSYCKQVPFLRSI